MKLEKTDRLPKGKRDDLSLREKGKQIQKNLEDMIFTSGSDITVLALVEKYTSQRKGMRHSTKAGYKTVFNVLTKDDFGRRQIRGVVRPAFQMAVDDDLIRRNSFEFHLSTVVVNDSVTREAITRKQERQYLEFVRNNKHFSRYYDAIYILFHTGLRICEFCGLIKDDIDLKEGRLRAERQLQRTRDMQYIMGHSDIGVTLNTYTHIGYEDASREMKKVSNA